MRGVMLAFLLLATVAVASAQQPDSVAKSPAVHFAIQVGAITDETQTGFSLSAIPLVSITRNFSAGVGVGLDSYASLRTLPLFGQVAYDFGRGKNRFRTGLGYGYARARMTDENLENVYGYESSRGGRLIAPQLGYLVNYDKVGIGFFVGMKFQRVQHRYQYPMYYDLRVAGPLNAGNTEVQVNKRSGFFSLVVIW
ncbi:MAG: hypothetical protein AB7E82_15135 [Cyclobacteriaceae bacterium]